MIKSVRQSGPFSINPLSVGSTANEHSRKQHNLRRSGHHWWRPTDSANGAAGDAEAKEVVAEVGRVPATVRRPAVRREAVSPAAATADPVRSLRDQRIQSTQADSPITHPVATPTRSRAGRTAPTRSPSCLPLRARIARSGPCHCPQNRPTTRRHSAVSRHR